MVIQSKGFWSISFCNKLTNDHVTSTVTSTLYLLPSHSYLLGFYQPKERWGHSTVLINNDLYVWGGKQDGLPSVHSSDLKLRMTSMVLRSFVAG